MKKRWKYMVIGAIVLVLGELLLEGIPYTNPPEWFRPIWLVLAIFVDVITIPAHLVVDYLTMFLGLPLLVKPTFAEMGPLGVFLLLGADALEGALLGWLVWIVRKHRRKHDRS
ncbi:MAG: hypothetical protein Q7R81_00470 [Candidatus Peregrinibacteria bacterium]|nr:hypothetical protein [Candidatus Peregrinibacteria bacterium]